MPSLAFFANQHLEKSAQLQQTRILHMSIREQGIYIKRADKKLISFSCNDYLGLTTHPAVKLAASNAIEKYGTGSGASRLITGNNPLYGELEALLAKIKNTDNALVFGSGYLANIGIIPALVGKNDLIIADKFIHASLIDGCKLSGAKLLRFSHNSAIACRNILQKHRKNYTRCLIITENIFSMDGDIAPVDALCDLAANYDAWLLTDDAHGLGVIANTSKKKPHLQIGTLSKAIGSYGGYVCAENTVIEYLKEKARSLVYTTALPPASLAGAIAALQIIMKDSNLCALPLQNAQLFTRLLGLPPATSAIVPVIIGNTAKTIAAAARLEEQGFLVAAIRPPTIPIGTSRLRFAFSALHNSEDIEKLAKIILSW